MEANKNFLAKAWKNNRNLLLVFIIGFALRLLYIGNIPGNGALFVDEMFSGYEAYSIMKYGIDFEGYHLPVYLPAWGSGMSAMQAYIQMPFILIFGLNSFALRLPAAILGCITIYAFYFICKCIRGEEFATFATFLFAVMPWHIMLSRWGLDCNYFAGFITISIALLFKATYEKKFLPLAFFFIGATLYTYALPWVVMPIFVLGMTVYFVVKKKWALDKYLIISYCILAVMAIPLILFVMVNYDIIPEISTAFISIPKLTLFRAGEMITSPKEIIANFYNSLTMFVSQNDGTLNGATPMFGLYYKFSGVFILIGMCLTALNLLKQKDERLQLCFPLFLLFLCSIVVASTKEMVFYRVNMIHMPMTFFLAEGLWAIIQIVQRRSQQIVVMIYALSCLCFMSYYLTIYDDQEAELFADGCEAALSYVDELYDSGSVSPDANVRVLSGFNFTSVLFYEKYPADKFVNEVVYEEVDSEASRILAESFGKYLFTYNQDYSIAPIDNDVYMCSARDYDAQDYLEANGFELKYFSYIVVGTK